MNIIYMYLTFAIFLKKVSIHDILLECENAFAIKIQVSYLKMHNFSGNPISGINVNNDDTQYFITHIYE